MKWKELLGGKKAPTFIGLVDESGLVETSKGFMMCFVAYANPKGELVRKEAVCIVPPETKSPKLRRVERLSIVALEGEQVDHHGQNRILVSRIRKVGVAHAALQAMRQERQKPVTFESERLGTLAFDRTVDWYEGTAEYRGQHLDIHLTATPQTVAASEAVMVQLLDVLPTALPKWHAAIEREILPLYNEHWREETQSELLPAQLHHALKLDAITINEDLSASVWFLDGDLLGGHSITVELTPNGAVDEVGIHG